MLKQIIIILIFLYATITPCFADFRFAVLGDTRDEGEQGINVKTMKALMDKIKSEGPDFIVLTGDMITGSAKSSVHTDRLKKWKGIIEGYEIPYYIGIGNHEIESEMSEDIIRSVFEMPENGPAGFKELIYSFDHKNAHFVILDTAISDKFHSIGDAQIEWLKKDLEKNQERIIFIFGHDPAYPVYNHIGTSLDKYSTQRDDLWDIFKKNKVSAYFCGHEHLYNRSIHDGIYQVITGGGGAHISVPKEEGGFNNYIIVDVKDNGTADIIAKDIDGLSRDIFNTGH